MEEGCSSSHFWLLQVLPPLSSPSWFPTPPHCSSRFSRLGITFFCDANQDLKGKYTWGELPTCSHPEALVQRVLSVR